MKNIEGNFLYNQDTVEADFKSYLADRIRSSFPKTEERSNLSFEEFQEEFINHDKPVVIKGATADWIKNNDFDFNYFKEKCGASEVVLNLYNKKKTRIVSIKDLIDEIKIASSRAPVYLQEWWFQEGNQFLLEQFKDPEYFSDDEYKAIMGFKNHTLWMGSKGSFTQLHEDTAHFHLTTIQLEGKKEWFFFNRGTVLELDQDGKPNYDKWLADPDTKAQSCIVERGDILFMPYKWWHRTEALEDSISLNTPYAPRAIAGQYMRDVFSIPLLMALKKDELRDANPMRYNVTMQRIETFAKLMNFDPTYSINAYKNTNNSEKRDVLLDENLTVKKTKKAA